MIIRKSKICYSYFLYFENSATEMYLVPKKAGTEKSWYRNVLLPKKAGTEMFRYRKVRTEMWNYRNVPYRNVKQPKKEMTSAYVDVIADSLFGIDREYNEKYL